MDHFRRFGKNRPNDIKTITCDSVSVPNGTYVTSFWNRIQRCFMPVDECEYVSMWVCGYVGRAKRTGGTERSYTHTATYSHTHTHGVLTSHGFETGLSAIPP